jgi:hypothetical protein
MHTGARRQQALGVGDVGVVGLVAAVHAAQPFGGHRPRSRDRHGAFQAASDGYGGAGVKPFLPRHCNVGEALTGISAFR